MATTRYERIEAHDGDAFDVYCALPATVPAPGVVLLQEVFGINDNMRGLAGRLAEHGYVTLVPDMFWRLQRRFESKDESGLSDGMALAQRMDMEDAVADMTSTLARLRGMQECSGKVGAVGFCLGGTLAYRFATSVRVDGRGPDAVVSYYGSGIHGMLDHAAFVECPMMFHYGDADPYITADQVAAVETALAARPDVTVHHYDAGHAFSNFDAPSLHQPEAADEAWGHTLAFLDDHLK